MAPVGPDDNHQSYTIIRGVADAYVAALRMLARRELSEAQVRHGWHAGSSTRA